MMRKASASCDPWLRSGWLLYTNSHLWCSLQSVFIHSEEPSRQASMLIFTSKITFNLLHLVILNMLVSFTSSESCVFSLCRLPSKCQLFLSFLKTQLGQSFSSVSGSLSIYHSSQAFNPLHFRFKRMKMRF